MAYYRSLIWTTRNRNIGNGQGGPWFCGVYIFFFNLGKIRNSSLLGVRISRKRVV